MSKSPLTLSQYWSIVRELASLISKGHLILFHPVTLTSLNVAREILGPTQPLLHRGCTQTKAWCGREWQTLQWTPPSQATLCSLGRPLSKQAFLGSRCSLPTNLLDDQNLACAEARQCTPTHPSERWPASVAQRHLPSQCRSTAPVACQALWIAAHINFLSFILCLQADT